MSAPLLDTPAIMELLPHRPPFLFVDRVLRCSPQRSLLAERDLRPDEPHFAGHFPGQPIQPGVLVTEALAQASGLLLALTRIDHARSESQTAPPPTLFYLASAAVKFTHPARPGQTLRLQATWDSNFAAFFKFNVEASVGRNTIAHGTLTLAEQASPSSPHPG